MVFDYDEIEALMLEDGKQLTILIPQSSTGGDDDLGISRRNQFESKTVIGYLFNLANTEMGVTGGSTQQGFLVAYISGRAISKEELKPGSQLIHNGIHHRIEYQFGITNQGVVMIHQLKLNPVENRN